MKTLAAASAGPALAPPRDVSLLSTPSYATAPSLPNPLKRSSPNPLHPLAATTAQPPPQLQQQQTQPPPAAAASVRVDRDPRMRRLKVPHILSDSGVASPAQSSFRKPPVVGTPSSSSA